MTTPGNRDDQFTRARERWRGELVEQERSTAQTLLDAYNRMVPIIQGRADALVRELVRLNQAGDAPTVQQTRELTEYTSLLGRVDTEMRSFSRLLGQEMATSSDDAVLAGIRVARDMTNIMGGDVTGVFLSGWNEPDPAAIANVVDYMANSLMRERIATFAPNAVDSISDLVLTYVAQGKNPRDLAQRITQWTDVPYDWADTMARTVQVYSYRGATHESYRQNSRVVRGWAWGASLDARTCVSCWAMHGKEFTHDETLNDHHRGRCTPYPIVRNVWTPMVSGELRFRQLSVEEQVQIMGRSKYEAWVSGEIRFGDLTTTYEDDVYGTMRRVASLAEARRSR